MFGLIQRYISNVPGFIHITDSVHELLESKQRLIICVGFVAESILSNSECLYGAADEAKPLSERVYQFAAFSIPLILKFAGGYLFSAPLPALSYREIQLFEEFLEKDENKNDEAADRALTCIFEYAFANERFYRRLEQILNNDKLNMPSHYLNLCFIMQEFCFCTLGLSLDDLSVLLSKVKVFEDPLQDKPTLALSDLFHIARISQLPLEGSDKYMPPLLCELRNKGKLFLKLMKIGIEEVPSGAVIVQNQNKINLFSHSKDRCYLDIKTYSHAFLKLDGCKAIDLSMKGIKLKKFNYIGNVLCGEVVALNFRMLIPSGHLESLLYLYSSEEKVFQAVELLYQEKVNQLATYHSTNPLDLSCAGLFQRGYIVLNKFGDQHSLSPKFKSGQMLICSAFVATLIELAIAEVNKVLSRSILEETGQYLKHCILSPFPPFSPAQSVTPMEFLNLSAFSRSKAHYGKLQDFIVDDIS